MAFFVYFDLGGVVILDMNVGDKWAELRRELGVEASRDKEFMDFFRQEEKRSLVGDYNIDKLVPVIRKKFNSEHRTNYSLLMDGFIRRFDKNKTIWPVIERYRMKAFIKKAVDAIMARRKQLIQGPTQNMSGL
jgi:hypothetical protein